MKLYELDIEGLKEQVRLCPVQEKHGALIALLQRSASSVMPDAKLAAKRDGSWRAKRKVVTRDGTVVHNDHEQWLHQQLEADGGHAATTFRRVAALKLFLSVCELETLYLVHDRLNDNPADFVQATVLVENEFVDKELFNPKHYCVPSSEHDLVSAADDGYSVPAADRLRVRPCAYNLGSVVDVGLFVDEAEGLDRLERAAVRLQQYEMTDGSTGEREVLSIDQLDPGWDRLPFKLRRLFNDWANSSAGKSGARFCDHWYVTLSDYTQPSTSRTAGHRDMHLIPQWTTTKKLAKVEGNKGNDYTFVGNLERLDQRVKVPFAWYFFMLHGNRVSDGVGKRMLQIAEAGTTVMPECDYQMLKNWRDRPYGF
jgi:hypothetical protein